MVGVFAFLAWGHATVPYTTSPIGYLAWVFLGGVAGFIVSEIRAMRRFFAPKEAEPAAPTEAINLDPLAFNIETGVLSYHGKACEIPFKSYQHMLCNKLFEHPGKRVLEYDILEEFDRDLLLGRDSRVVRDVVYAVNRRTKADLGIKNLFLWSKATVWINEAYTRIS